MTAQGTPAQPINTSASTAPRHRLTARVATLLLVGLLGLTALAGPAAAYTDYASGRTGYVTVPVMQANSNNNTLTFAPRTAYEVPAYAGSAQYVCLTHRLYRIERTSSGPRWVLDNAVTRCGWIGAAANSIYDAGYTFYLYPGLGYSTSTTVTWQLSNGTLLGTRIAGYEHTGDYRCLTSNCVVGTTGWGGGAFVQVA